MRRATNFYTNALVAQLKMLLDGSFLNPKENLLLFGNPGAGKSHLLCALARD